jgi:hypothetical protein
VQIAAFALALAAWKAGGYRPLSLPNLACSGIAVGGSLAEWVPLAGDDVNLGATLERLYHLFRSAPTIGSLIDPTDLPVRDRMFATDYTDVAPLVERALTRDRQGEDPVVALFGAAVQGSARAAALLARTYTLVATNVPFLTRRDQDETLCRFSSAHHSSAKGDLSTVFIERCRRYTANGGSYALVSPQNWLFLATYTDMRKNLLESQTWNHSSRLGAKAFSGLTGEVVRVVLTILTNSSPCSDQSITSIDAFDAIYLSEKIDLLRNAPIRMVQQSTQLRNPDARIVLESGATGDLLSKFARAVHGINTNKLSQNR